MRYIPLNRDNKPLVPYKSRPELGLSNGLEDGDWITEAVAEGYGVGVLLDNSGMVVIDCDSSIEVGRKVTEHHGWRSFRELCREEGFPQIPATFTVTTRTPQHYHFYYLQHPDYPLARTSIHSQVKDVDVKVTGFVVSWHTAGYALAGNRPMSVLPAAVARRLYRPSQPAQASVHDGERSMTVDHAEYLLHRVAGALDGERNVTLHRAATAYRYAGLTDDRSRNRLVQAAVLAGLRDTEAMRTVESAWRVTALPLRLGFWARA